jgi:hypothetical protein
MVDSVHGAGGWTLHSDFTFHWTAEDVGSPHVLKREDLDFSDSPADPDTLEDNTITGNSSYHVVNQSPSVTLAVKNDWWGSAGGLDPGKISESVDYDPWLTSAPELSIRQRDRRPEPA